MIDQCRLLLPGATFFAAAFSMNAAADFEAGTIAEQAIDQIVVVANKSERSIRDVAANVTVLSQDQLGLELAVSMSDVLRYTPGIDYEGAGTRFDTESINIRGIGGNRVAMLVDGVPLSEQFSVGSFSNATRDFINAGFVQQIEVLHGPASALYGSSAIGGVMALRTPDPHELAGGARGGHLITAWRGADSSLHGTGMHAIGNESAGLLMGISLRNGHEYDSAAVADKLDTRDYERRAALLKLVADDAAGNTWKAAYYHQQTGIESSLNSMLGSGRFRSTTALEGDDEYRMDLASAEYGFGGGESFIDAGIVRAYYGKADIGQRTYDERGSAPRPVAIDRYFDFEQKLRGVELNLQKRISGDVFSHRLGFGIEYRERRTEEFRDGLETGLQDGQRTSVLLGEIFPLRDFPISEATDRGAYLEDAISFSRWTVIAALRADRFDLDARNDPTYEEDYPFAAPVSLSESDLSPKLGVIFRAAPEIDLYFQYSRGFRAPPFEDANIGLDIPVFNVRAIPNPDLGSESSDGFDVGMRWQGTSNRAHLSFFRSEYEDFIATKVRLGPDPLSGRILFQSQNIDAALIEGIEAGWSLSLAGLVEGLWFDGSFYWARGENRENGAPLNSVGPAQAVVGIKWSPLDSSRHVLLRGTFTEDWDDRDQSSGALFVPPGYAVLDIYAAQRVSDRLTLRAGILNLTDQKYWVWSDVRGLAPDDPVIPYLSRPGISLTAGVDINW